MQEGENLVPIYNKLDGTTNMVSRSMVKAYLTWQYFEELWWNYAKYQHDTKSPMSAKVLIILQNKMDEAWLTFKPWVNRWMIAREGISLN